MSEVTTSAPSSSATPPDESAPVVLRGTARGLEILVSPLAAFDAVLAALRARLEQSPGFFAGSDVTLRIEPRALPVGGLTQIEAITQRFGLRIVEVRGERADRVATATATVTASIPTSAPARTDGTEPARMHIGPVRSGVVLEVQGQLVVLGDVNPGAEVRATGNIIVVGTLRGLAHAAYGGTAGAIIALRFHAQQLRIGGLIARAGDGGGTARGAEIAYATGGQIVVESYQGKLPSGLPTVR